MFAVGLSSNAAFQPGEHGADKRPSPTPPLTWNACRRPHRPAPRVDCWPRHARFERRVPPKIKVPETVAAHRRNPAVHREAASETLISYEISEMALVSHMLTFPL
jgi:hypothetical protein